MGLTIEKWVLAAKKNIHGDIANLLTKYGIQTGEERRNIQRVMLYLESLEAQYGEECTLKIENYAESDVCDVLDDEYATGVCKTLEVYVEESP